MTQQLTEELLSWYDSNKAIADRIISDSRRHSYESIMHVYEYASKLLKFEDVVYPLDFRELFSANYPRVGNNILVMMAKMYQEDNYKSLLDVTTLRMTAKYWLACGNLYEVLVDKLITKMNSSDSQLEKEALTQLVGLIIHNSLQNGIKNQNDWDFLKQDETSSAIYNKMFIEAQPSDTGISFFPMELDTEEGRKVLDEAIKVGLCDEQYQWQKTKSLLAYFCDRASEYLQLNNDQTSTGRKKVSWQPFEVLFKIKSLKEYKNNWQNKTGVMPKSYEIVDGIFDRLKK